VRQLFFALFVPPQNLPCPRDDLARQASQPRDFNAVTLVRAARFHAPQKNNFAARLLHRYMHVLYAGQKLLEFGQLVIMGREQSSRLRTGVERFHDRPRDRQPVERRRAAANLV